MRQGEVGQFGVPFSARDKNSDRVSPRMLADPTVYVDPERIRWNDRPSVYRDSRTEEWEALTGLPGLELQRILHPALGSEPVFRVVFADAVLCFGSEDRVSSFLAGVAWGVSRDRTD